MSWRKYLMVRSFIQISAAILTIGASFLLIKANLSLTPNTIARSSCTIQGWGNWATANKEAVANLAKQSAYTRSGFILLIIAFLLQMISLMLPMEIDDLKTINFFSILISIGFSAIIILISCYYSNNLSNKIKEESLGIIEKILRQDDVGK